MLKGFRLAIDTPFEFKPSFSLKRVVNFFIKTDVTPVDAICIMVMK